jgi:transposase
MQLTNRQREIKTRLDQGMQAREIATELGITRNAVYQQIQRLRKSGVLEPDFTPSGLPSRELPAPGSDVLVRLLTNHDTTHDGTEIAGALALVAELRRTRDELSAITRRLSQLLP